MPKNMPMIIMMIIMLAAIVFTVQGVAMHNQVNTAEDKLHELNADYWSQQKAVRDSAPTDSELNNDLVKIMNFPSELLRLKLVGVGKILTGIFILLFGILIALIMMPIRLHELMREDK